MRPLTPLLATLLVACASPGQPPKAGPPAKGGNVSVSEEPPVEEMLRAAHAELERRDHGAARIRINRLLLGQPEHLEARVLLAMIQEAAGEAADADETWKRVERIVIFQGKTVPFELQPTLSAAALRYARDGKGERSRLFLDELWRRFPTGEWSARTQLAIAEAEFAAGRWARAAQACDELIRIRTGHPSGQRCATLARASRRMLEVGLDPTAGAPAWSWEHPQPQGNTLHDVWVGARGELCAVGEGGTILERRGKELRTVPSPTRWSLHRLAGGDRLEGLIAVGAAGVILRHDGKQWTLSRKPSPEHPDLWGAWASEDGKQAVAVGDGGAVVELRGGAWVERRVSGLALRCVVGVGDALYAAGEGGALLRAGSADGAWQSMPSDCYEDLWSATGLGDGKGLLLVGNRRTVVRFDGQRAQETIAGRSNLRDLWSAGAKQAWAVGVSGDVIAWNGKSWRSESAGTLVDLLGVGASKPSEVWAVGAGGTVLVRRGARWTILAGAQGQDLIAVSAAGGGYALGDRGQLLRRKGTTWRTETHLPAGRYRDLWVDPSGARAVAVGDRGLLVVRSKAGWKAVASETPEDLVSVHGLEGGLVAVGTRGTVVRLSGDAVQKDVTPTGLDLHAVWGSSPRSIFAVGNRGVVLRFDGERWTEQESGTLADLHAVSGLAADQVLAAGAAGTVIRLEGGRWRLLPAPVQQTILDLWAGSPTQILAVTARGAVVGLEGKDWRVHASPAACLRAVHGHPGLGALAVGCHGSVLRLPPVR